MKILSTIAETKEALRPLQKGGLRVALVPTMGALHEGHLSLVKRARSLAEVVVASIFVNPLQFGPGEDLERYPRDLEGDAAKLEAAGAGYVFTPTPTLMYPDGFQTKVGVTEVTQGLCGASRAGHFDGVATVVLKLFTIVAPDFAIFGEKDFQQLTLIRTMARDLNLDVSIVGAPLVREPDGLAMSSRNAYLSAEERTRALQISDGLFAARAAYASGERSADTLLALACPPDLEPEYLELRHFTTLAPLSRADEPCLILTAARVGATRLIDNVVLARP